MTVETVLSKVQKSCLMTLAVMLVTVMALSTMHLGFLTLQEICPSSRFLLRVQGLLAVAIETLTDVVDTPLMGRSGTRCT
jgi:hypothetical protein